MRLIKTTYSKTTPESVEDGDFSDTGWEDEAGESMEPDEYDLKDGITAVDLAVNFLFDKSASWCGRWWETSDPEQNYSTGENTFYNYHPEGFTETEIESINLKLKEKHDKYRQTISFDTQ